MRGVNFVELTSNGSKLFVNCDHIQSVFPNPEPSEGQTRIMFENGYVGVDQDYQRVRDMIVYAKGE